MKRTSYYCDACGEPLPENRLQRTMLPYPKLAKYDLCADCVKSIDRFFEEFAAKIEDYQRRKGENA